MNKIVSKEHFSANVVKLEVEAPLIARSRKAGHFVIVKVGDKGERIPLTIAGADTEKGTITLVIQAVGGSSRKICELNEGDYITDVVGPLGQATHIEKVESLLLSVVDTEKGQAVLKKVTKTITNNIQLKLENFLGEK